MTFKVGDCVQYVGKTIAKQRAKKLKIPSYNEISLKAETTGILEQILPDQLYNYGYIARMEEICDNEIRHNSRTFFIFELDPVE